MAGDELTWREPPSSGRRRRGGSRFAYEPEAAAMRANPGKWLLLETFEAGRVTDARNMRSQVNSGRYHAFRPAGAFDSTSAKETERSHDEKGRLVEKLVVNVYARYVGPEPEA